MKKFLSLKGLAIAAMLFVCGSASADTYYRTFHVVASVVSGEGEVYITTQNDPTHGEYTKFDTDLESGFACTMGSGYGRLFFYPTPADGYVWQGVKVFDVLQDEDEPADSDVDAALFTEPMSVAEDGSYYEVMIFPGDAQGETDEEKMAWSPYGVAGVKSDYASSVAVPCNDNPDAYVYMYFKEVTDGIEDINATKAETAECYDINGMQKANLTKGINIIRNGKDVRKVIIK
ncbi:MAG: hypothetical protein Q4F34_07680 [Prevotellaceae bacterium]|nr:hypothetical protein [Prevotellaceae bacterium]